MRTRIWALLALAAACSPAAEEQAAAPAAPDTAAVRAELQGHVDRWVQYAMAGDAAGIASLYTEDATYAGYGFPTTTGRANLQTGNAGYYGGVKVISVQATVEAAAAPAPGIATARGTYADVLDSNGVTISSWWRWAAAYRQGADGLWLMSYHMAFPDSTRR